MNMPFSVPHTPWYREPWPWFLMSLPAASIIAGIATVWLAARSADGLVVGDYYKAGLAINQTLAREETARALGIAATLERDGDMIVLRLTGRPAGSPPGVRLTLVHPTRTGFDRNIDFIPAGADAYRAVMPSVSAGKWLAHLSDDAGIWRITGVIHTPLDGRMALGTALAKAGRTEGK